MVISINQLKKVTELRRPSIIISIKEIQKIYEDLFEEDLEIITKISEEMIEESIKPLLSCPPKDLQNKFEELYSTFFDYNVVLSFLILKRLGIDELYNLTEKIGQMLENTAPLELKRPIEVIYDCSLLILKKIRELGQEEFLRRIEERFFEEYLELNSLLSVSNYLLTACLSAKIGLKHKPETLEILTEWLNIYIKELERYTISFNLTLTNEYYETVKDFAL